MLTTLLSLNVKDRPQDIIFENYVSHTDFDKYVLPEKDSVVPKISSFVEGQLPDFIRADHPKFLSFIEAYYEWLESKNSGYSMMSQLKGLSDIDDTIDDYIDFFKSEYLNKFPIELASDSSGNIVDKKTIIKNIRDFYEAKGTEKSYEFLFRILYDAIVDFYYPKTDILKVSDGKWTEEKTIKITTTNGTDNFKMKNREVFQYEENSLVEKSRATVDKVTQYSIGPIEITELYLSSISGSFTRNRKIYCDLATDIRLEEKVYNGIGEFEIFDGGKSYTVGDSVEFKSGFTGGTGSLGGFGAKALVNKIDRDGKIVSLKIENFGVNYMSDFFCSVNSSSGSGAVLKAKPKTLNEYVGFYVGNDGKLSSNKRIQDGDYYQDYSYVIKAEMAIEKYRDIIKNIVHPAGLKMFGDVAIFRAAEQDLPFHSQFQRHEVPLIGHYTPYTFGTTFDLRSNDRKGPDGASGGFWLGEEGDLYPLGYNPIVATGPTGTNFTVGLRGMTFATVPEGGYTSHYPGDFPLGTAGAGGPSAGFSADTNHQAGGAGDGPTGAQYYGYSFWEIYHHPNARNLDDIAAGTSFGGITIGNFIELPFGFHFHSNPGSEGDPYYGPVDSNYSSPHGTTYSNINETLGGFTW